MKTEGLQMNGNSSPLEHLASTLISFALGVTATVSLALYSRWLQGRANGTLAPSCSEMDASVR